MDEQTINDGQRPGSRDPVLNGTRYSSLMDGRLSNQASDSRGWQNSTWKSV